MVTLRRLRAGGSDFEDGGDRLQDHVGDGIRLRDHDHVGALDFGDLGTGALGHRSNDIGSGRLVAGCDHGPAGHVLPRGRAGRFRERQLGGRSLGCGHQCRLGCREVGGERAAELRGIDGELVAVCDPCPVGYWSGTNAVARTLSFDLLSTSPRVSPSSVAKRGDEDETDDVLGIGGGVAEHGAAVRVPDRKDGAGDLLEHTRGVGGVDGEAAQRVRGGDHVHAVGQESFGDAVPARRVGKRAVHEYDGEGASVTCLAVP